MKLQKTMRPVKTKKWFLISENGNHKIVPASTKAATARP